MTPLRQNYNLLHCLATLLYPSFFVLDLLIYPAYKWPLLNIRLVMMVYLLISYLFINRSSDSTALIIMQITLFLCSFVISLMCFVTKAGFDSPYYVGVFLVVISSSVLINLKPKYYLLLLLYIFIQHFVLLSFLPFNLEGFLKNIFFLVPMSFIGVLIQQCSYTTLNEIRTLQGLLPICAQCKKIRDDKGYWHRIETYIESKSEAQFTHGICPRCYEKLYGEPPKSSLEDRDRAFP